MAKELRTFEPSEIFIKLNRDHSAEAKILDLDGVEQLFIEGKNLSALFTKLLTEITLKEIEYFKFD